MSSKPPVQSPKRLAPSSRRMAFAEQELRLISALVVLIGIGLFLALPFVLSIGSVVFLPLTTAVILMILLSPLADRLSGWGLPNVLASLLALLSFLVVLMFAFAVILQPAGTLLDQLPQMAEQVARRFEELQDEFAWLASINDQLARAMGTEGGREVVLAGPSFVQQIAVATPSLLLEVLLTFLMAFFMIEARVRLRRHLLFDRASYGTSIKAARVLREVQDRVAAYILTVACINLGVGVIVALGAWLLGVDAPLMWGGLAALLNFIPYIGPFAMIALLALFGLGTADALALGMVPALAYLVLHTVESNIVTPSILGARFTMNPVMILIAFSYFSWIWGVFGALLSVPILLMLTAFFDHVGRPNLVGFVFGEPLFATNLMALGADDDSAQSTHG
ncbi:AI-2E family transporter [Parerythrobacter lacustris]|uniref:AI-2E family transporter n=1 Tax=Parerythrobacter lacustris TaxID=2969984 RepID=A0ABT1XNA6_9SPHN|nr:AI-2E family transporter [Parerythrobacter lacustris]MCR2832732.1 AI-2E family transporter [Parerythrobacter lacustris]